MYLPVHLYLDSMGEGAFMFMLRRTCVSSSPQLTSTWLFGSSLLFGITAVTFAGLRNVSNNALPSTIFICCSDAK